MAWFGNSLLSLPVTPFCANHSCQDQYIRRIHHKIKKGLLVANDKQDPDALRFDMTVYILVVIALFPLLVLGFFSSESIYLMQAQSQTPKNDKVVILTFGDGWTTQYTNAK